MVVCVEVGLGVRNQVSVNEWLERCERKCVQRQDVEYVKPGVDGTAVRSVSGESVIRDTAFRK